MQHTPPRGELTLIVAGAEAVRGGEAASVPVGEPAAHLRALVSSGTPVKEAIRQVAQAHRLRRRAVYEMALVLQGKRRRGK